MWVSGCVLFHPLNQPIFEIWHELLTRCKQIHEMHESVLSQTLASVSTMTESACSWSDGCYRWQVDRMLICYSRYKFPPSTILCKWQACKGLLRFINHWTPAWVESPIIFRPGKYKMDDVLNWSQNCFTYKVSALFFISVLWNGWFTKINWRNWYYLESFWKNSE